MEAISVVAMAGLSLLRLHEVALRPLLSVTTRPPIASPKLTKPNMKLPKCAW